MVNRNKENNPENPLEFGMNNRRRSYENFEGEWVVINHANGQLSAIGKHSGYDEEGHLKLQPFRAATYILPFGLQFYLRGDIYQPIDISSIGMINFLKETDIPKYIFLENRDRRKPNKD